MNYTTWWETIEHLMEAQHLSLKEAIAHDMSEMLIPEQAYNDYVVQWDLPVDLAPLIKSIVED